MPFSHYYSHCATQTIYTPAMTGLSRLLDGKDATITRMAWEYTGRANFNTTKMEVYLDQTEEEGYPVECPIWQQIGGFPIATIDVPFVQGRGFIIADLDFDYTFDPSKSLVVTIVKSDESQSEFLAEFRAFDANWRNEVYHSLLARVNGPIDIDKIPAVSPLPRGPRASPLGERPQWYRGDCTPGNGAVYYNGATRSVEAIDLELAGVEVYNLSGALVSKIKASGNSATINCPAGIYLLKAVSVDGNYVTIKACVR